MGADKYSASKTLSEKGQRVASCFRGKRLTQARSCVGFLQGTPEGRQLGHGGHSPCICAHILSRFETSHELIMSL